MLRRNSLKQLIPPDSIIMSFSRPNAQTTDVCKWLHEHGAAEDNYIPISEVRPFLPPS